MTTTLINPITDTATVDAATRREFLTALAAAGLLTGCASTDAPPAPGGPGYPRTIVHQDGTAVLDARPERVVAIDGRNDLDALIALGITPAAAALRFDGPADPVAVALYGDALDGVQILDDAYTDVESVAAARPDVILGQNIGDPFPTFARIAPTVSITFEDWRATTRMIAQALGIDNTAAEYIARVDADIAALAEPAGSRGSFAILDIREPGAVGVRNDCNAAALLRDIGHTSPLGVDDQDLSTERLGELAVCEQLFVLDFGPETSTTIDDVLASDLYRRLPAVQARRDLRITETVAFTWYFPTALTVPACLADLRTRLAL